MSKTNYLSPTELIDKYPDVAAKFNWSPRELGDFFSSALTTLIKLRLGFSKSTKVHNS